MLTPRLILRQRNARIGDLAALFIAELLPQLDRTCRAALDTFTTGNAACLIHFGNISRAGHIWCIEQLRRTQRITDIDITVTDSKNLVCTIDISDLVYKAVFFCSFKDLKCLFFGNIATILLCLHNVICHITHSDAPALRIIRTALTVGQAGTTAGTRACRIFALVLFQPVGNMLKVDGFIFHLNGLFHRNDMHTNTGTTFRYERCDLFQRQTGHMFKKCPHLRIAVQNAGIHIEKFSTTRHVHRQYILFDMGIIFPVVFQETLAGHFFEQCFTLVLCQSGKLHHLIESFRLSDTHFQSQLCFLIRQDAGQSPVLRIVTGDLFQTQLLRDTVSDLFAKFCDWLAKRLVGIRGEFRVNVVRVQLFIQFFVHPFSLLYSSMPYIRHDFLSCFVFCYLSQTNFMPFTLCK